MDERDATIQSEQARVAHLLARIKAAVLAVSPDAEVMLFGSRARGDARADSDWDLLIVVPGTLPPVIDDAIRDRLYEIEVDTGEVLCSVRYSREEWERPDRLVVPFRQNVRAEAIAI